MALSMLTLHRGIQVAIAIWLKTEDPSAYLEARSKEEAQ